VANILHIDTAGKRALVMIARDGIIISKEENTQLNEHASFVHTAIQTVVKNAGLTINDINAVAVANGPGSYTGLRVGLAAAKGICYVLKKELILINSLQMLAEASRHAYPDPAFVHIPMIDARRMEVFTAIYNNSGETLELPHAALLDESSFKQQLDTQTVIFSGDAVEKWKKICSHPNAVFTMIDETDNAFASLSYECFMKEVFADLAYSEPFYCKDFHLGN